MKLVIIRHGDPNYALDTLTPTGWEEARLVAERVAKMDVKAFYLSPLGRAQDTASLTLKKMGRTGETLPWLREFAGRRVKDGKIVDNVIWDWLPKEWTAEKRFFDRNAWLEPETFRDSNVPAEYKWVTESFDELLAKHGYRREGDLYRAVNPNEDTLVFFCHFGLECVLLGHLLGISPFVLWHGTAAAPTSVTIVNTEEREKGYAFFRMSTFGDTSHLYVAEREPSFSARFCETYDKFDPERD